MNKDRRINIKKMMKSFLKNKAETTITNFATMISFISTHLIMEVKG